MFFSLSNISIDFKDFIRGNRSNAFKSLVCLSKEQEKTRKNVQGMSFGSGFSFHCVQIFHQLRISSTVKL